MREIPRSDMVSAGSFSTRAATFLASGLAIAVSVAWVRAGAALPDPADTTGSPMARLLALAIAYDLRWVAAVVAWSTALNVVLAAVLAVFIDLKVGRNRPARWLAASLAMAAAGIAVLFVLLTLPPLDRWVLGVTQQGSPPPAPADSVWGVLAVLLLTAGGCALLGAAALLMLRFWRAYPGPVDGEALAAFLRGRLERPMRGWFASRFRQLRWKLLRERDDALTDEGRARIAAAASRYANLFVTEGFSRGSIGRRTVNWFIFAALGWWALTLVPPSARNDVSPFVAAFGLFFLMVALATPTFGVSSLLGYHGAFGDARERRRVEWILAAAALGHVLLNDGILLAMLATLIVRSASAVWTPELPDSAFGPLELAVWTLPLSVTFIVMPALLTLALVTSILGRGMVDPRLAVRRVSVWTLLGLMVTFVFLLVERFAALQLARWLSLPVETGAVIAGAAVAATFVPLRRAAERWVNRFLETRLPVQFLANGDRQVGAVAVVDISGFTALSAIDASAALLATTLVQREAKRLAEVHEGRVVKFTGDGAMLTFASAGAAATAVRELYAAVASGAATLGLPPIVLHSGLDWGEFVAIRDADIYGHTVNLASRLAEGAGPGEIMATAGFAQALGNVEPAPQPFGTRQFRNVPAPVECVRL